MIYVFIIIIILLIMPIEIVFTKDDKNNDIDIYLTKLFNIRLDFDEALRFFLTTKENREQVSLSGIKYNYNLFKLSRNLISSVSTRSHPKKLSLVLKVKKTIPEIDVFVYVAAWNFINYLKNSFHKFIPRLKEQSYDVVEADKFSLEFKWSVRIRFIYIIFSLIKNYKDAFNVIKFLRKGSKKYGKTSNI